MSCKVLLADDDDGYRFPFQALLEDYGYTVLQANSKEDVLREAGEII